MNLIWKDKRKEALFVGWDWRRCGDDASVPLLPKTDSDRQQVCGLILSLLLSAFKSQHGTHVKDYGPYRLAFLTSLATEMLAVTP